MSVAKIYRAPNRLAGAVDTQVGVRLDTVLVRAQEAVRVMQGEMTPALRGWVMEIDALCKANDPDLARLAWLANGVFGVGGACGLEGLARCGALFGRAIEIMAKGDGWRSDAARIYSSALVLMMDGAGRAAEEAAVLSSLEAMNRRLSDPDLSATA